MKSTRRATGCSNWATLLLALLTSPASQAAYTNTIVSSVTCRQQHEAKLEAYCRQDTCILGHTAYSPSGITAPTGQRELCVHRLDRSALQGTVVIPLDFVDDSPTNCSQANLILKGFQILKRLENGTFVDVFRRDEHANLEGGAKPASQYWCPSDTLNIRPDPFQGRCAMVLTAKDSTSELYGILQASMPNPDEPGSRVTQDLIIEEAESGCDVCFGAGGSCQTLHKSQMKTSSDPVYSYEITAELGKPLCFLLKDTAATDRESYWSYASASTAPAGIPLQYARASQEQDPVGQWKTTGFNVQSGASVNGVYRQCVFIPRMTDSLYGTYVYHHFRASNDGRQEVIVVEVSSAGMTSSGSSSTVSTTIYYTTSAVFAVLLGLLSVHSVYRCHARRRPNRSAGTGNHPEGQQQQGGATLMRRIPRTRTRRWVYRKAPRQSNYTQMSDP